MKCLLSSVWIDEVTNTWKVVGLGGDILYRETGWLQACPRRDSDSQTSAGLPGRLGCRCWGARGFPDSTHLSASASSQPRPLESFRAGNVRNGQFLLALPNRNCRYESSESRASWTARFKAPSCRARVPVKEAIWLAMYIPPPFRGT